MNRTLTIPAAIVAGGIILAIAVYFAFAPSAPVSPTGTGDPALVRPVSGNDHIFGNPAAPVKIIEYSDYDCAYCKDFDATLRQVIATDGANGSVAWVFRNFPLTELHTDAQKTAEAAECAAQAGGNEAYWKFAALLFENQPADPTEFGAYAKAAGVPGQAFASCYADAATLVDARIASDSENALQVGAQGTPYSVIVAPGKTPIVMNGAYSYDAVRALLKDALGN